MLVNKTELGTGGILLPFDKDTAGILIMFYRTDWVVFEVGHKGKAIAGLRLYDYPLSKVKRSTYSGFRPNGSAVGELLRSADPPEGRGTTQFIQPYRARSCLFPEERVS